MEPFNSSTRGARSQADDLYDCLSQELENADFTSTEGRQLSSPGSLRQSAGKQPVDPPVSPCQESEATVEQHRPLGSKKRFLDASNERGGTWKRACPGGSEVRDSEHVYKQSLLWSYV